mmetsp:Transcript_55953/g.92561  ORF Transcript_55953/g.92561 Transcript_55953/m.92561 type:complete len:341 (-) Transcript_55953:1339-2361(-)
MHLAFSCLFQFGANLFIPRFELASKFEVFKCTLKFIKLDTSAAPPVQRLHILLGPLEHSGAARIRLTWPAALERRLRLVEPQCVHELLQIVFPAVSNLALDFSLDHHARVPIPFLRNIPLLHIVHLLGIVLEVLRPLHLLAEVHLPSVRLDEVPRIHFNHVLDRREWRDLLPVRRRLPTIFAVCIVLSTVDFADLASVHCAHSNVHTLRVNELANLKEGVAEPVARALDFRSVEKINLIVDGDKVVPGHLADDLIARFDQFLHHTAIRRDHFSVGASKARLPVETFRILTPNARSRLLCRLRLSWLPWLRRSRRDFIRLLLLLLLLFLDIVLDIFLKLLK